MFPAYAPIFAACCAAVEYCGRTAIAAGVEPSPLCDCCCWFVVVFDTRRLEPPISSLPVVAEPAAASAVPQA
jgi:hypothetical protein